MARGMDGGMPAFEFLEGSCGDAVRGAVERVHGEDLLRRIWNHDHTAWRPAPDEITNRLGWLHSPETMAGRLAAVTAFCEGLHADGYTSALLLGMGGSSLGAEVFRRVFGGGERGLDLAVLDSTDPAAILRWARDLDPARTLYLVSTKSGGTVETFSFLKYFLARAREALGAGAGRSFAAITDPGSGLARVAEEQGFRETFLNDPNIGGRYSALSFFGLVPAALTGVDLERLMERVRPLAVPPAEGARPVPGDGAWLGAALGALALEGRDKLTLVASRSTAPFGPWVEQLVAESTGKEGKGILPVAGEALAAPQAYGDDRVFVELRMGSEPSPEEALRALAAKGHPVLRTTWRDAYDLGAEFFRWELATAVAGAVLGINPFDQPDVESAKVSARKAVQVFESEGTLPLPAAAVSGGGMDVSGETAAATPAEALRSFLKEGARPGGYVALQAFVDPEGESVAALEALRSKVFAATGLAVTVGFGPRFLHSTGQLHKGDAGRGLFVQFLSLGGEDAPIPGLPGEPAGALSFGTLKTAQALGDRQALLDKGRKVLQIRITGSVPGALRTLAGAL